MSTRSSKRALSLLDKIGGRTKKARRQKGELKQKARAKPESILPLIWNFLLEASDTIDPTSTTCTSMDFKSISSFMLVNKAAKEAFDACNGWAHCLGAIGREIFARKDYLQDFCHQVRSVPVQGRINDDDYQRCQSLYGKIELAQSVQQRLTFLQTVPLPVATRLVSVYSSESALSVRVLKEIVGASEEEVNGVIFAGMVTSLRIKMELEAGRRILAEIGFVFGDEEESDLNDDEEEEEDDNEDY